MKFDLNLSERLRRTRRLQKRTQREVCELAGPDITVRIYGRMEWPGSTVNSQFDHIERVIQALGGRIDVWLPFEPLPCPIDYVMEGEGT